MCDPENIVAQEREEARAAERFAVPGPRELRNPFTGVWVERPSRAELEREEREAR